MLFASLTFLFFFLPVTLFIYYVVPKKWRNICLLIFNLVFYGWGEPVFLIVIAISTCSNYIFGGMIARNMHHPVAKKRWAVLAVSFSLGLLVIFKYANFLDGALKAIPLFSFLPDISIPLPLGISFYTFHVISYIVDIYRGDSPPQKSLIKFAVYISLFPQMIAGPIARYKQMQHQLGSRKFKRVQFSDGVRLLLLGLGKKVLIANQMGQLFNALRNLGGQAGMVGAWAAAVAYALQIYFDFGGYTDMARGLGKMFGFELPQNFNSPYAAKSVTDFWRRWHMSLSFWFRDYVYIPLGGSRVGLLKTVRNLFIVWVLTGFWHGANWNFLLWGLYYFILLTVEKVALRPVIEKAPFGLGHIYTILTFLIGWTLFAFEDFGSMGRQLAMMFGGGTFASGQDLRLILSYLPLMCIGALGCLPVWKQLYRRIRGLRWQLVAESIVGLAALGLCTASLISQSYNPFLYFRF